MKVIGINGSPRAGKTTSFALGEALEAAAAVDPRVETELIEIGKLSFHFCTGCNACSGTGVCAINDDFTELLPRLIDPSVAGVIVGTPVYMGTMTGLCKDFLDRCVVIRRSNFAWTNVVGAVLAVGAARNGGQELTIQAVQAALMVQNMVIVSDGPTYSHYGATLWSRCPGGIEKDELGLETARALGSRVAQLALKLHPEAPAPGR